MNTHSGQLLVINAGSSSLKLAVYEYISDHPAVLHDAVYSPFDISHAGDYLQDFISAHGREHITTAIHRVVHGGKQLVQPCIIDTVVENEIERLAALAPLHIPIALRLIRYCREYLGSNLPQIAVFDTAFFAHLPVVASTYALPRDLLARHDIRRYGFHGIAHQAMWQRWCELNPGYHGTGRVITLQLGGGSSMAAIRDGAPLDTSMGFSPLGGLVMSTRPGDVDPGLLIYLQEQEGLGPRQLDQLLNTQSGLLGLSGFTADMRELLAGSSPAAQLAIDIYCYQIRKYIGAYLAVLGGADAVIFSGGIGLHAASIRRRILKDMSWCGVNLHEAANEMAIDREHCISTEDSQVAVWVMNVDEAAAMVRSGAHLFR